MISVVGLDLSTASTGIAMPDGSTRTIKPRAGAEDPARRLNEIVVRLDPYLRLGDVDLVVIEGYNLHGKGGPLVLARLAEIGGAVRMRMFELAIPFVEVNSSTLKVYALGTTKGADKAAMKAAAERAGAKPANHDEADAWHLRAMAIDHYEGRSARQIMATNDLAPKRVQILQRLPWPRIGERASA